MQCHVKEVSSLSPSLPPPHSYFEVVTAAPHSTNSHFLFAPANKTSPLAATKSANPSPQTYAPTKGREGRGGHLEKHVTLRTCMHAMAKGGGSDFTPLFTRGGKKRNCYYFPLFLSSSSSRSGTTRLSPHLFFFSFPSSEGATRGKEVKVKTFREKDKWGADLCPAFAGLIVASNIQLIH